MMDRLKKALRDAQQQFDALTKSTSATDRELAAAAKSQGYFEAAAVRAASSVNGMNGALSNTVHLAGAVQTALLGFVGLGFIRGLMDTTGELQKINMTFQAVAGSAEGARKEMAYVERTADSLGQNVLTAAGAYAQMLAASNAAGISLKDTRNVFEGVTAAATAFGLSQYELEGALLAIQQMISKGSVQAEELRGQLGERLPGAFAIAARSMNMTTQELSKALSLGKVQADEFVKAFGVELKRQFGGFAQSAQTSGRAINELDNAMLNLKKSVIDNGFQDALIKVLDTLTGIAASEGAAAVAKAVGAAFKWMADNAELAAVGLGLIVAAISPFGGIAAIIGGVAVALAAFSQRTFEFGGEQVKVSTIVVKYWELMKTAAIAAGQIIVGTWGALSQAIGDIVRNFAPVIDAWGKVFSIAADQIKNTVDWIFGYYKWLYDQAVKIFSAFAPVYNMLADGMNQAADIAAKFVNAFIDKFEWLYNTIVEIVTKIKAAISNVLGKGLGGLANAADALGFTNVAAGLRDMQDGLNSFGDTAKATFGRVQAAALGMIAPITDGLQEIGSATADAIGASTTAAQQSTGAVSTAIDNIGSVVKANIAGITALGGSWDGVIASAVADTKAARQNAASDATLFAKVQAAADAASDSTSGLGNALATAGKKGKKAADDLKSAKKVFEDQVLAYNRAGEALAQGLAGPSQYITKESQQLEDALRKSKMSMNDFLKSVGLTREEYMKMLGATEQMTKQLDYQKGMAEAISGAFASIQSSGNVAGGVADALKGISDSIFGDTMKKTFDDLSKQIATNLGNLMKSFDKSGSMLSSQQGAAVGTGITNAIVGGLNENSAAVGSGIGQAAGAAIGSIIPGIGTALGSVLGSVAGGLISKVIGGGHSEFKRVKGTAFEGTTYAVDVKTDDTVKVKRKDLELEGRLAFQGVKKLLEDYQGALTDYVAAQGGTVQAGTKLVVDQTKALKAITGALTEKDIPGLKGGKEAGEKITAKVQEIMALGALIVQKAGPPLTEAQTMWRDAQEKFSATNQEILRSLGFSVKQIAAAQRKVTGDIVDSFNSEVVNTLVDTGRATKAELDIWKATELKGLEERRAQALATAREIGANVDLVQSSFNAQRADILEKWKGMLDDLAASTQQAVTALDRLNFSADIVNQLVTINDGAAVTTKLVQRWYAQQVALVQKARSDAIAEAKRLGVDQVTVQALYDQKVIALQEQRDELLVAKQRAAAQAQVDAITKTLDTLNTTLTGLESQRSDVLQELTKRSQEARDAEQALADARKSFATSTLSPGGPLDVFRTLQQQFDDAAAKAKAGDASAAKDAASIAQQLLDSGRGVYGSTTDYAALFGSVDNVLSGLQKQFGDSATVIDNSLDKDTFADLTQKNTAALLTALGTLNASVKEVSDKIAEQTRKQAAAEQKAKVA